MATGTEIERLFVKIEGDIAGLKASMSRAKAEVVKGEKAMGGPLDKLAARFTSVSGAAQAVGGTVGLAATALLVGAKSAVKYADDLNDTAIALGINVERLQELRYAAQQNGVQQEEMDRALMKLNLTIGDAVRNGGQAADKFRALGITITDVNGNTRDTGNIFDDVVAKLSTIPSAAERASAAGDLMGDKLGPRLNQLLGVGTEGMNKLAAAAHEAGAVMDADTIERAAKAQDQLDALGTVIKANLTLALVELAPVLVTITECIADVARGANVAATALRAMFGASPFPLQDEIDDLTERVEVLQKQIAGAEGATPEFLKPLQQELIGTQSLLDMTIAKQAQLMSGPAAPAKPETPASGGGGDSQADIERQQDFLERLAEWDEENAKRIEENSKRRAAARRKQLADEREAQEQHEIWWLGQVDAQQAQEDELADAHAERVKAKLELDQAGLEEYKRLRAEGLATDEEVAAFQTELDASRLAAAKGILSDLSALMASSSRKMFEVGKAAAISQTIVDTIAAAQGAYRALASIPYVGPYLGAAAAIAATAAGMARVQAIKSTSFGSRSVAMGVGGGMAVGSPAGGGGQGGAAGPTTLIRLEGDTFSRDSVEDLLAQLNEGNRDGGRVVVVGPGG